MRVAHICSYYLGTQLYQRFLEKLQLTDVDHTFFVPSVYGSKARFLLNPSVVQLPCFKETDRIIFHLKHYKIYSAIHSTIDSCGPFDMIHAHALFTDGSVALKLKQQYGTPYIVAVRNTDVNVFFKYMLHLKPLGLQILKNADQVVFLSESYRNQVINHIVPKRARQFIRDRSVVIPNGIDDYWLNKQGTSHKLTQNCLRFIFAGEINRNKNVVLAAEAISQLQLQGYQVRFTVAGRINDNKEYESLKKYSFVDYVGVQTKEALSALYQNQDIFIMPSHTETFGLVYAEAMSQGLPVLYTKGQGFDLQFQDGLIGYSVSSRSISDIVNKINLIIDQYEQRSERCCIYSKKFSWGSIADDYTAIYHTTVTKKMSGSNPE